MREITTNLLNVHSLTFINFVNELFWKYFLLLEMKVKDSLIENLIKAPLFAPVDVEKFDHFNPSVPFWFAQGPIFN